MLQKISNILGLIVGGIVAIGALWTTLAGGIEKIEALNSVAEIYIQHEHHVMLPLQLQDSVFAMKEELDRRGKYMKRQDFRNTQTMTVLFGELNLVEVQDDLNRYYYFWENEAGDLWIKTEDHMAYIIQYQNSEDYFYYRTYDGDYVKVKPQDRHPVEGQGHDYTEEDFEELDDIW